MTFNSLKQLFSTRRKATDGSPLPKIWVSNKRQATLINPESGRVYAYVRDDRCTLIVSPFRALYLILEDGAELVSLLAFPRCTVEVARLRGFAEAQQTALYALGYYDELDD